MAFPRHPAPRLPGRFLPSFFAPSAPPLLPTPLFLLLSVYRKILTTTNNKTANVLQKNELSSDCHTVPLFVNYRIVQWCDGNSSKWPRSAAKRVRTRGTA